MREIRARGEGTLTALGFEGVRRIWGFQPLPNGRAHLLVGIDEREILSRIRREMTIAYGQLAVVVILVLLGAWTFGEHTILRPIRALARAAERIGRGDLSIRTGSTSWAPEFLPLTRSLDSMAVRLGLREHSLRRESDRFRELAATDGLTGLSNRRAFDTELAAAWQRAATLQEPTALLMMDVDHFKRYNDCYGHVDGDACLRIIGNVLAGFSHGAALAARYGGEEFALLLPGADQEEAVRVADAIRHTVQDLAMPHGEAPAGVVTVSIGLASLTPGRADGVESLITAADSALYASKRTRNTVTAYTPVRLAKAS
jgi:diguanylate cyclase (GGDEF)-like protein